MTREAVKSRVLRAGDVISERYRVERVLRADPPRRRYLAVEKSGERRLDIVELPTETAVAWTGAMTIEHPGLPPLLATLSRQGGSFGVFERVDGKTFAELIAAGARFEPVQAARVTLWLCEAVARLHRAAIHHGAIDPECIVFRSADPESVLLAYRGPLAPLSPFRPPERDADEAPGAADDLWGLAATLFQLLTLRPPPADGVYSEEEVRSAGIEDEVLRGVIAQGLAADPARRSERIESLRHPISHWLASRAARAEQSITPPARVQRAKVSGLRALGMSQIDDPSAPAIEVRSTPLSEPPPPDPDPPSIEVSEIEAVDGELDEAYSESLARLADTEPPARHTTSAPLATTTSLRPSTLANPSVWLGLALGALVTIGLFALLDRDRSPPIATQAEGDRAAVAPSPAPEKARSAEPAAALSPAAPPSASASAAPPELRPVAHRVATESTVACVARHMPEGSFRAQPDMEFLCRTHDPRRGDHLLRAALVEAADGKAVSPGMRMWSNLTWYGMAGYAALRAACCPDAPAIELPKPAPTCSALGPLLDQLGRVAASGGDIEPALTTFRSAVDCEIALNRGVVYWRKERPGGVEPTTARALLDGVAKPRPPQ